MKLFLVLDSKIFSFRRLFRILLFISFFSILSSVISIFLGNKILFLNDQNIFIFNLNVGWFLKLVDLKTSSEGGFWLLFVTMRTAVDTF